MDTSKLASEYPENVEFVYTIFKRAFEKVAEDEKSFGNGGYKFPFKNRLSQQINCHLKKIQPEELLSLSSSEWADFVNMLVPPLRRENKNLQKYYPEQSDEKVFQQLLLLAETMIDLQIKKIPCSEQLPPTEIETSSSCVAVQRTLSQVSEK